MGVEKRTNDDLHKSPTEENGPKRIITRQMMACKVCKEPVSYEFEGEDIVKVQCKTCGDRYHGSCAGITSTFFYNMITSSRRGWICYNCTQDRLNYVQKIDEKLDVLSKTLEAQIKQTSTLSATMEAGFTSVAEKFEDVDKRFNIEIEIMKERLSEYERKLASINIQSTNEISINNLPSNNDITYMRDLQRKNNLIIQNIPSLPSENQQDLKEIVKKVANACGSDITHTDIASVIRLRKKPTDQSQQTRANSTLLVKFIDVTIKDDIFGGYIRTLTNKRPLTSSSIGTGGNTRVYINQHLSPELVRIKMKAVKLKETKAIAKVAASYNVVKVLYKEKWHKLHTMQQLEGLITEVEAMD